MDLFVVSLPTCWPVPANPCSGCCPTACRPWHPVSCCRQGCTQVDRTVLILLAHGRVQQRVRMADHHIVGDRANAPVVIGQLERDVVPQGADQLPACLFEEEVNMHVVHLQLRVRKHLEAALKLTLTHYQGTAAEVPATGQGCDGLLGDHAAPESSQLLLVAQGANCPPVADHDIGQDTAVCHSRCIPSICQQDAWSVPDHKLAVMALQRAGAFFDEVYLLLIVGVPLPSSWVRGEQHVPHSAVCILPRDLLEHVHVHPEELLGLLQLLVEVATKDVHECMAINREEGAVVGGCHAVAADLVVEDGLVPEALTLFECGYQGLLAHVARRVCPHLHSACKNDVKLLRVVAAHVHRLVLFEVFHLGPQDGHGACVLRNLSEELADVRKRGAQLLHDLVQAQAIAHAIFHHKGGGVNGGVTVK
mmetsp:Transcript_40176/g.89137  ORF Transcript_40176/g.89137 Transcript_40176/m.89137 type:complete len:420 (-) Transcript_40176:961-2220(-)